MTLVQHGGEARSAVVPNVAAKVLGAVPRANVDPSAHLMTDELPAYRTVGKCFDSHELVLHKAREYVRGDVAVNRAESFFGQLKRSIDRTHHHVSREHLRRYLREFDFRFSTRGITDGEQTPLTTQKGRR